jgi:hypothetical protein
VRLVFAVFSLTLAVAGPSTHLTGAHTASAARKPLSAPPPHLDAWLLIAKCEQPKPGGWGRWGSVHWHQTHNYTFPGGAGMQTVLWQKHRRAHMRRVSTMDKASPLEQVWAMYRFWRWAERTYPGYGYTGWECSAKLGWTTSDPADLARRAR